MNQEPNNDSSCRIQEVPLWRQSNTTLKSGIISALPWIIDKFLSLFQYNNYPDVAGFALAHKERDCRVDG
jgi:hypothetical protein